MMGGLAILSTAATRRYGARNSGLAGSLLLGLGLLLSGFATESIGGLFFTSGIMCGVGSALCFMVGAHPSARCAC